MEAWMLAQLFPPVTRFFIGVLLVLGIVTLEALTGLLIYFYLYGNGLVIAPQ